MRSCRPIRQAVIALGFAVATLGAQSHPRFAGTWVADGDKSRALQAARAGAADAGATARGRTATAGGVNGVAGGGTMSMSGAPPEVIVTQTDAALTIARGAQTLVYDLAGSERVNVNGRTTLKTRSHWEGSKLVTQGTQSTSSDQGPVEATFREVRSLDKDGAMIVETTRQFIGSAAVTNVQAFVPKK
jgi:hypothetical protein